MTVSIYNLSKCKIMLQSCTNIIRLCHYNWYICLQVMWLFFHLIIGGRGLRYMYELDPFHAFMEKNTQHFKEVHRHTNLVGHVIKFRCVLWDGIIQNTKFWYGSNTFTKLFDIINFAITLMHPVDSKCTA